MTNDPSYEEQLRLLAGLDFSHPSDDMPLTGNVTLRDRFQRASYFSGAVPPRRRGRSARPWRVMAIARNASVPFGAPYSEFGVYDTEYRTVCDLTNLCDHFELTSLPQRDLDQADRLRPPARNC